MVNQLRQTVMPRCGNMDNLEPTVSDGAHKSSFGCFRFLLSTSSRGCGGETQEEKNTSHDVHHVVLTGGQHNSAHSSQQHHQSVVEIADAPELNPLTMVPALSPHLREAFGRPHTQFPAVASIATQQHFIWFQLKSWSAARSFSFVMLNAFVIRMCHINKLLAIYHQDLPALQQLGDALPKLSFSWCSIRSTIYCCVVH
jgi:hypothetical protein